MPEPTKIAMRKDFTLPSKYLFKQGIEPWKPKAVKKTGLAEINKALSIADRGYVLETGKVVLSGGPELAARLEQEGYAKIAEELGYEYHEEA